MIGIMAVCGLPLIACTACKPSMPGMRWSMKIASGRLFFKYSMACSADSAMSTSMSYFSSMRLKMTRADFESSTTSARLRAISIVYRSPLDAESGQCRTPRTDSRQRIRYAAANPRPGAAWCGNHCVRPAETLGRGLSARRFFVLRNPRQRGFDVGELAGGKPFDLDAGRLRLFLGEFGGRDRVYPHQTAAYFSRELLLLTPGP